MAAVEEEQLFQKILRGNVKSSLSTLVFHNLRNSKSEEDREKITEIFNFDADTGERIEDKVNKEQREEELLSILMQRVRSIKGKEKCQDIFLNVKINDHRLYMQRPYQKFVNYKNMKKGKEIQLNKMRLLKNLKAFVGFGCCTFLEIALKEIELMKELFVMDLEQGDVILIPDMLKQHDMSINYRYYDYLLPYVNETMQQDMRDFFNENNKLNIRRIQDDADIIGKLKQLVGADRFKKFKERPIYFKRDMKSFQEENEIDPITKVDCTEL